METTEELERIAPAADNADAIRNMNSRNQVAPKPDREAGLIHIHGQLCAESGPPDEFGWFSQED